MARILLLNIFEEASHPRQVSNILAKTSITLTSPDEAYFAVKDIGR
jgi:hypothetical protein